MPDLTFAKRLRQDIVAAEVNHLFPQIVVGHKRCQDYFSRWLAAGQLLDGLTPIHAWEIAVVKNDGHRLKSGLVDGVSKHNSPTGLFEDASELNAIVLRCENRHDSQAGLRSCCLTKPPIEHTLVSAP